MRRRLALPVVLASSLLSLRASATDVQVCVAAAEKGQRARSSGKLREARDSFLVCNAESCPSMIRKDCTQWQSEVSALLPTVVFGAKDRQGRDLFDVSVSMDGEVVAKKLDGKAVGIDPGPHTFKFEMQGVAPVTERALVKEGEKARAITVSFAESAATPPPAESGPTPPSAERATPPPASERTHTVFPWIVVGLGAAALIGGGVVYFTSPETPAGCSTTSRTCARDQTGRESAEDYTARRETGARADNQPIEGLLIAGAGVVVIGGGLLWHFLEPTGPRTGSLRLTPWAAPGGAGTALGASF